MSESDVQEIYSDEKIGEGLVRIGAMTQEQVDEILRLQEEGNDSLFGVMALELGYIDEDALLKYLEEKETRRKE
jgi:nitroreductase